MGYLDSWRSSLPNTFHLFGGLLEQDKSLNVAYGIVAGALLWPIRSDGSSPQLIKMLVLICGTQDVQPILNQISLLQQLAPLAVAQSLSRAVRDNETLRDLLNRLLEYFREDWIQSHLLRPTTPSINVSGSVEGANIVIGGVQYVAGDLVISQMVVQPKIRSCPTAPNPPPHFAGRQNELQQLESTLKHGKTVAISGIQGMGGIGKTALALYFAAQTEAFSAVLWASLGPEPTVLNHLLNWARHADPDFEPGENPVEVLASRIQSLLTDLVRERCPGRVLVILDDIWEGNSVATARLLQKAAPINSVYLITTRSQLVVAQLRSTRLELKPLSPQDALEMLRNLLIDYPTIADEVLLDLAEVVGYHPLAMELAAGQVTLLERPEQEVGDLINRYRGGIPAGDSFRDIHLELGEAREDNLEIALWFSYTSLLEEEQACFRELGVLAYAAPFDQSICRAVWSADPKPSLDVLRHRAMLGIADAPGWYQQHPLLRSYARALLNQRQPECLQVLERYSEFVVNITAQFNTLPLANWNRLEPFVPHMEEVGTSLVARTKIELDRQKPDERVLQRGLSFALHTSRFLSHRREVNHPDWLEMGLSISQQRMDLGYLAFFLDEIGRDSYFHRDMKTALKMWHQAVKTAEAARDKLSLARTNTSLGLFYLASDPIEAPKYLRRAIALYEELHDPVGLVDALIRLADWHAGWMNTYEKREEGLAVLERALATAQAAGYESGMAEVKLKQGRLHDTLGNRDEAVPLLTAAATEFQELGLRDREGNAHLFLASALANLKQFEAAHAHLEKALPLFKTTGDMAGLATVLRNLGQLYAFQGQREHAIAKFAEALPLTHKQTMRFLDEDEDDAALAACFFFAQLEDVVKLDLVEQFRQSVLTAHDEGAEADQGEEGQRGKDDYSGFIPDDLLKLLVTETIRAKTAAPDAQSSWSNALQDFIYRLTSYGGQFRAEVEFASALYDVTVDRAPVMREGSLYYSYIQAVAARIAHKHKSPDAPFLSAEEVKRQVNNTLAVRITQPGSQRMWSTQLRKLRRSADLWGENDEKEFYAAQLAVLSDRLVALSPQNAYYPFFEALLSELAQYKTLPRDFVLQHTVAVKTTAPEKASQWLDYLQQARRKAIRWGEQNEQAFLEALIRLVENQPAHVTRDSPYHTHLERAKTAIARRTPLVVPLPAALLASIMEDIIAAKTSEPKIIDLVADQIHYKKEYAGMWGRTEEVAFYDSLLAILYDGPNQALTNSPYQPVLKMIIDEIQKQKRQPVLKEPIPGFGKREALPDKQATIPLAQIDNLIRLVIRALTQATETLPEVRAHLQSYRRLLETRPEDWEPERRFTDALLATLAGQSPLLPSSNPYQRFLAKAVEEIKRYGEISAKGGRFSPDQLDALLRQTALQVQAPKSEMDSMMNGLEGGDDTFTDHLKRLHEIVSKQNEWKETLIDMREQIIAEEKEWRHEVELLNALIAVIDTAPASVSLESPYSGIFQSMLKELDYQPGIPDMQTQAMTSGREEFSDYFADVLSGKAYFIEKLDTLMMNTVLAKTIMLDRKPSWATALEKTYQELAEQSDKIGGGKSLNELEFVRALQSVLQDESPTLPDHHPYQVHLCQVVESIRLFHGQSAVPQSLTGDQILQLYTMTAGAMTIGKEHFSNWKETLEELRDNLVQQDLEGQYAVAFINALLIVMEGRPADLPLENPYRPYLHLTQLQIRQMQ